MNNNNDDKILQEMDKDLEELNQNENKVNETLDKTNHSKEIFKKLEKHLSPDIPTIKFYDKIKYRGTSVIGVNFQSNKFQNRFYSRTKINELGNKISRGRSIRQTIECVIVSLWLEVWYVFRNW